MDGETSTGKLGRTIARGLALLAIAAAAVAVILVVSDSLSDSGGDGGGDHHRKRHQRQHTQTQNPQEDTYVVQPNDTMDAIAEKTGISLEKLQALNCRIDPQALPAGATLQLRKPAEGCGPSG